MRASTIIKRIHESGLSREDLLSVEKAIRAELDRLDAKAVYEYLPGDYVKWMSRKAGGTIIFGKVEKTNRKSVSIEAKNGVMWRVHPSFLERSTKEEYDSAPEFHEFVPRLPRPR